MSLEPDQSIPDQIVRDVRILELKGMDRFNRRQFDESRKFYAEMLDLLKKTQEKIGRPIHKGAPLHMIGLSFTGKNQHNEALHYITLAYIEDTLNAPLDNSARARLDILSLFIYKKFSPLLC
jgi:exopolyphosphatase/pppGpp-phosphohydrolase